MFIVIGVALATGGAAIGLWYRTVVSLPRRRQPAFIHRRWFKWGFPAFSAVLCGSGLYIIAKQSITTSIVFVSVYAALFWILARFDRYYAEVRIIYDYFDTLRRVNPALTEPELLYLTAEWRYPKWSHDRLVELIAGKDVKEMILLILIQENEINPIADWHLYRRLKQKIWAAAGARDGVRARERSAAPDDINGG